MSRVVQSYDIIVAGEGPAGLMAAGEAALRGKNVVLLGRTDEPGKKLLITGGGRCNLTNTADLNAFMRAFGKNGRWLRQAFNAFFNDDLIAFFEKLGLEFVTEENGCVFPKSSKARDVRDALVSWAVGNGVEILKNSPVSKILVENHAVAGVVVKAGKHEEKILRAKKVIIATGGASYKTTGSTGNGYRLAADAGHNIVAIRPALVPLETKGRVAQKLQGVSLAGVPITLFSNGKKIKRIVGNVVFTHFGLSGPGVLLISKAAMVEYDKKREVEVSLDLVGDIDLNMLDKKLAADLHAQGKQQVKNFLRSILQRKMVGVIAELAGMRPEMLANQVTAAQRKKLAGILKDLRFSVLRPCELEKATVTAGGVDTKEIDPRTMESKVIEGLYFAGEVIDIDGDTGGYNLQAAFSTGFVAGKCAREDG